MSLTRKEAFKRLFIKQCADEGLVTDDQVLSRINSLLHEKQANAPGNDNALANLVNWLHSQYFKSFSPQEGTPASPLPTALALGVGLPAAAGAGLGYLGSKLKGNWLDEEDVKNQELTEELRRQTALARQFRRMGGTSPSSF